MRIECPICGKIIEDGDESPSHVMCAECAADYGRQVEEEVERIEEDEAALQILRKKFGKEDPE